MAKHRSRSRRSKKVAAIGAATVTATALTVGAAPPLETAPAAANIEAKVARTDQRAVILAAVNYTQLITDSSNSLDNLLLIFGNVGGAAEGAWNPIASATGGLLPTFTTEYDQDDLTTIPGILGFLTDLPDVGAVPGIPPEAAAAFLAALTQGLVPITGLGGVLGGVTDTVLVPVGAVSDVLGQLEAINELLALEGLPLIGGIPTLNDLLGLTGTVTTFQSGYDWPILGVGGTTTIGNTFVQLPELTVADLLENVQDIALGLPADTPLSAIDGLADILGLSDILDLLGPEATLGGLTGGLLDGLTTELTGLLATPSITAWIPAGSGSYSLPLGGSVAWLATMPTIAIGPLDTLLPPGVDDLLELGLDLDGLTNALADLGIELPAGIDPAALLDVDLSAETVIAIPIFAGGATLPLGLGAFSIVTTPGITFPTQTGVSTIAGTTVMSFNILGFGFTNVNTLASTYVGTDGVNHNSGTNLLALTTPLGPIPIPIPFSLGAFNSGTTGFGFTGPSLFGVGLFPPFQVGTAPSQQSADGLIPAALLNLFLAPPAGIVPTQLFDLTTLLGLPNPLDPLESGLNPLFNTAFAPFGSQITDALNSNIGPLANGFAGGLEQLTALLAGATGAVAPAGSTTTPAPGATANPLAGLLGLLGLGGSLPLGGSGGGGLGSVLGNGLGLGNITQQIQDALDNVVGGLGAGSSLPGITSLSNNDTTRVTLNVDEKNGAQDDGVQDVQTQTTGGVNQAVDNTDPPPAAKKQDDERTPRKGPLLNLIKGDGNSATSPAGATGGSGTGSNRPTPLRDAVSGLRDSVKNFSDGVKNALGGGNDGDDRSVRSNRGSGDGGDDE
jgi:hypothetical protein